MSSKEGNDLDEEILVFAEFEDGVNIENYRAIHVLGINGKNPIIQMDETIFTGQLENPLGTYLFFAKDFTPQSKDPLFDKLPKENVKYLCKASKYLNMKHTYITPKDGTEQGVAGPPSQADDEIEALSFQTVQEALEKFKQEWDSKMPENDKKHLTVPSSDQEIADLSNIS